MTSIGWDCCRHGEGARLAFQFAARSGSVRKCWWCALVHPPMLWRSVKIGIVVGSVLAVINHGGVLVRGEFQCALGPCWWRRIWQLPSIMVIGVGAALSTSLAVLGAFHRSLGLVARQDRCERFTAAGLAEIALGLYCALAAWLLVSDGQYTVAPFLALYAFGFLTVGGLTLSQSRGFAAARARGAAGPASVGAAALLLALTAVAPAGAGDTQAPLVEAGECWWRRSPDPTNPVACATCHFDREAVRGWAPSFPKFKPLPPPAARVMTLLQANAEAVERHYRLAAPLPVATAITAYLNTLASDLPLSPGMSTGQPVFPSRVRALEASVRRGEREFRTRCGACHDPGALSPALRTFPRMRAGTGEALERFLETHRVSSPRLGWDGQPMADLLAYLASRLGEQPVGPGPYARKEKP